MEETGKREEEGRATGDGPAGPASSSTGLAKADAVKRGIAMVIDGIVAGLLAAVIPAIGFFLGAVYILLRDGFDFAFMDHRSLGKKVMKLRPVTVDGSPMDMNASMRRNWVFALPTFLFIIPILGWFLIPVISLAITAVEVYLVVTKPDGRRWGDKLAKTQVIETAE